VELRRADLAGAPDGPLVASGVFQFADSIYEVTFHNDGGLTRCLDFVLAYPEDDPAVARLHLTSPGAKFPSCNLRFHYNIEHRVAAAVLIAFDTNDEIHSWMSRGTAGRGGIVLSHDTWNPDDTRFPSNSFISVDELRAIVSQWAFGDVLPPPAIEWVVVPEIGWL
jgi:hypothetical protein